MTSSTNIHNNIITKHIKSSIAIALSEAKKVGAKAPKKKKNK